MQKIYSNKPFDKAERHLQKVNLVKEVEAKYTRRIKTVKNIILTARKEQNENTASAVYSDDSSGKGSNDTVIRAHSQCERE